MMNKLILFCTFAIFMLAVGGAVTPVWAHADCGPGGKGKHSDKHPHCGVVNEDSTDDGSLYLVWVDGDLILGQFTGHDPVGRKEAVTVNFQYINMDLSYIQDKLNDDSWPDGDGDACFTGAPVEGRQTVLSIEHDRDKALAATYVFSGFGTDGTPQVGYRLKLSTSDRSPVDPGWRPTEEGVANQFFVKFDQWEVGSKKDIACNGSGSLDTTISIRKTN